MKKSRERAKGFVIGFVVAMVLSSSIMVAASTGVMREIFYGVNIMVNGEMLELDDDMQPFIMGGRTFLPVRIIEQIVDIPVNWDGDTHTVHIGLSKDMLVGKWRVVSAVTAFNLEDVENYIEEPDYDAFMEIFADGTFVASEYGHTNEYGQWEIQHGQFVMSINDDPWSPVTFRADVTDDKLILIDDSSMWGSWILTLERIE
ncbi:MAG: copper amine oxidase N-terminal domain-containing protein [Defluviitaleaceae bacterium]|nr:copper amine oxidase N-terminal domain-containing protein [Defluviitaleaceae bacterium]